MTVQQFSVTDPLHQKPANRSFLIISIICFVIACIFICTALAVVLTNNEPTKQPRVDSDYGDLSSKTSDRSSLLSLIQPSSFFAQSVSTDSTLACRLISGSPIKPAEVSTRPVHNSSAMMMYSSTIMVSATSALLQVLSSVIPTSSERSWTSPVFHTSSIDFSSNALSSFYSPVLSSSLVNTTIDALVTLPVCSEFDFTCHSGECVKQSFRCNRYQDCQDKSDEENCPDCVGVQCDSGLCLWSWLPLCNGVVDCPDLSDEVNCASDSKIQCDNGVWISTDKWCNGIDNCYDNSDERNCSCLAVLETMCGDGKCIRTDWICDGFSDCTTDEIGCDKCGSDQHVCDNYSCISGTAVCDGVLDCPHGEEETQCFTLVNNFTTFSGILVGSFRGGNYVYPVCSTNWNPNHSDTVCRSLGHGDSALTLASSMLGAVQYLELIDNQTDTQTILPHLRTSFTCQSNRTVEITCMPKECGRRSPGLLVPFISGGDLVTRGRWPWVVSLSHLGKPICSGVLINPRWVLTAGHCMAVTGVYNYTHTPNYIQVLLGSIKRSRDLDRESVLLRAVKILHHPDMKWTGEGTIYWDIALIQLERPVTFTSVIQPICLSSFQNLPVTSTCFLTGWGNIEPNHDTTVEDLREVKLRVWGEEACRNNTLLSEDSVNTNFTLCAGYTSGMMSGCRGDSGSSLMCVNHLGQWSVEGIMSSGGAQCGVPSPRALRFTKVTATLPWIREVMSTYG